jgi:hypothetical protein
MPVIACPGCGKQYKVAETAAGQVAKCACGKRFRLGGAQDKSSATRVAAATASRASTSTSASPATKAAAKAAPAPADDFWDDAISIADKPKAAPAATESGQSAMIKGGKPLVQNPSKEKSDPSPKKKRKKSKGIRWGFDWGKVVGGLGAFLIFGGLAVAIVMSTGRVSRGTMYLAVPAIAGLFTAINGLMGEEGIW